MNEQTQMNRNFGFWNQRPVADGFLKFQNPRPLFPPTVGSGSGPGPGFGSGSKPGRVHWKRNKAAPAAAGPGRRSFHPKKRFSRFAPLAPRNTTSFIIRAKRSGGNPLASESPCPVTPAILPTPRLSPTKEELVEMAEEEWGVNGYGSMKGLIRLRSAEDVDDDDDDDDVEVGSSRFEMVCPPSDQDQDRDHDLDLESRVDGQDSLIAKLEEENLTLKDRMFLMEEEMGDLRRRLLLLENGINSDNDGGNYSNNYGGNNGNDEGEVCSEKIADSDEHPTVKS